MQSFASFWPELAELPSIPKWGRQRRRRPEFPCWMNSAGSFALSQSRMSARFDDWNMIANEAGSTLETQNRAAANGKPGCEDRNKADHPGTPLITFSFRSNRP